MTNIGCVVPDRSTFMMEHLPYGESCHGGSIVHNLWRFPESGERVLVARVQCMIVFYRATASLVWHVAAPEPRPVGVPLVLSQRAFDTEGDAMDALLRLEALAIDGKLPMDLRDAI